METNDKIIRGKILLQKQKPFFAYILLNLKISEDNKIETICVNQKGEIKYNNSFIESLSDEEIKGVVCHECLHIVFEHLTRQTNRNPLLFNVASDIVVNNILVNDGLQLPKNGLIPINNQIEVFEQKINEIDKKSAEQIYELLLKKYKKQEVPVGFDIHEIGEKDEQEIKKWKKVLVEASTYARQQGNLPKGMERMIDDLLNQKVNWKHLLYKYITNEMLFDYTYNSPSKRSIATGIYMPSMKKENIKIYVSIDTSGSISQEELTEFVSEIIGIGKSFNNITIKVLVCDCEIHQELEVRNGDIPTIRDIKLKGGGGTSFSVPLDYIKEKNDNEIKLVIFFTDGYAERVKLDYPFKILWVITKGGTEENVKESGEIIRLD